MVCQVGKAQLGLLLPAQPGSHLQLFRKLLPTSGFVFFIQNKEN
jgi:hypothetical protein